MSSELKDPEFHARLKLIIGGEQPFAWATKIGISKGAFSRIWNEGTVPGPDHLRRIGEKTGYSIDWLLTGEGEKRRGKGETTGAPLDEELLEAVLEAVEEYLDQVKGRLKPDKKAKLVAALYDMYYADEEKAVDKATVIRLVKLAV